jgi:dTDP-4-dehydrorhamnose 3,5-epimerase
MNFKRTPLEGVWVIEPRVFRDARGLFFESYNARTYREGGIGEAFVQDNVSRSVRGTLRGLHYQLEPHAQGKLVRVTSGEVFDVAVDIRRGSPTFGRWFGLRLSGENLHALYVPPGFAHGFLVLSDFAEFHYKCTDFYAPESDRGIRWNDPAIGIEWPVEPDASLLSQKDRDAPLLADADINFRYAT